jgi:hypothetical protein
MRVSLGRSLLRDDAGYRVAIGPHQMKTHQAFEAPLPDWLTSHLDFYIEVARPALQARSGKPDEGWLWLGAEGEPMTGKAISRRIRLRSRFMTAPTSGSWATCSVTLGMRRARSNYIQAKGIEAARHYHGLLKEQGRGAR